MRSLTVDIMCLSVCIAVFGICMSTLILISLLSFFGVMIMGKDRYA